jgi:hypothetical protein
MKSGYKSLCATINPRTIFYIQQGYREDCVSSSDHVQIDQIL